MRYAGTETLLRLNQQAKLNDLNQWVKLTFLYLTKAEGLHLLGLAFPHPVGADSGRPTAPEHYRTVWYVEMGDGETRRILLDVTTDELHALPEVPGTDRAENELTRHPGTSIVLFEDAVCIDGKHAIEIARRSGITTVPAAKFPSLADDQVEVLRNAIRATV
jgi:hypothetical protein